MLELALYLALTLFVESFGHLLAHELDGQTILKISRHTPFNAAGRSGGGAPANSNCMKVVEAIEKIPTPWLRA